MHTQTQTQTHTHTHRHTLTHTQTHTTFDQCTPFSSAFGYFQKFFPDTVRYQRYAINALAVAVMLVIVVLIVLGLVVFRVVLRQALYESSGESGVSV